MLSGAGNFSEFVNYPFSLDKSFSEPGVCLELLCAFRIMIKDWACSRRRFPGISQIICSHPREPPAPKLCSSSAAALQGLPCSRSAHSTLLDRFSQGLITFFLPLPEEFCSSLSALGPRLDDPAEQTGHGGNRTLQTWRISWIFPDPPGLCN